jgi:predicted dehydrogenase
MKIAVIGCGVIAASHLRILKKIKPDARIYLCDIDRRRAESLAARLSVEGVYSNVDDLLSSEEPDAVHITTPPHTHAALAEKAILADCHVFVEKPVTETVEEYKRISSLAQERGKVLCCDYSALGMPVVMKAMQEIRSGNLGRLIAVHCSFADSNSGDAIPYGEATHWAYRLRGGVLQNMIDHPASLALAAMEEIQELHVFVARRNVLPYDCPDLIHVSVRSEDQMGSFTLSMGHGCHERWAQFLLEGGSITIDMGRQLYSCTRGTGPQNFVQKTWSGVARGYAFAGGTVKNILQVYTGKLQRDPGIVNVMDSFYQAAATGKELLVPHRTMMAITTLLEEIWKAIKIRDSGPGIRDSAKANEPRDPNPGPRTPE